MATAAALPNDWALIANWALAAPERGIAPERPAGDVASSGLPGRRFASGAVHWRADTAAPDAFGAPPV